MYSGGFYPFPSAEIRWAWWAGHIYFNRYVDAPQPIYKELLSFVKDKDYFVITTNVDHQFRKSGFDKKRLFYTQGDYGLFQSVNPEIRKTYDNEDWVMQAMEAQGFVRDENGMFQVPADDAEQYSFYRILKRLNTGDEFQNISTESKLLYGLMLDRLQLSIRNQWFDALDRIYIIYTVEDIMADMHCSNQKACKTLKNRCLLRAEKAIPIDKQGVFE